MKKRCFLLVWMILSSITFLPAQDLDDIIPGDRNVRFRVAVGDFDFTPKKKKTSVGSVLGTISEAVILGQVSTQQDQYANDVRASILKGFTGVRRFDVIDGYFKEEELSKKNPALYVDGTITNITTTTELYKPSDKSVVPYNMYRAHVVVTVNLKDAYDDHVISSKTFNVADYELTWLKSVDAAINEALKVLANRIARYHNELYPLNASIVESGNVKKDKQKEVYIDLGAAEGAVKDLQLTVYSVKMVAGRYAQKELGRIKIMEVMGDEISLCKVQKGGKEIKEALDNGLDVVVVTQH